MDREQLTVIATEFSKRMGPSFRMSSVDALVDLIENLRGLPDSFEMPSSDDVKAIVNPRIDNFYKELAVKMSRILKSRPAKLYVDYEGHANDFICGFLIHVEVGKQSAPKLKLDPFCFEHSPPFASGNYLQNLLISAAKKLKISEKDILKLDLVTDGLDLSQEKNICTGFRSHTNSGIACIDNFFEHLLTPTESAKPRLSKSEKKELENCVELLHDVFTFGQKMGEAHDFRKEAPSIPLLDWFITYKRRIEFIQQVYDVFVVKKQLKGPAEYVRNFERNSKKYTDIFEVLAKFDIMLDIMKKNEVSIHHFLPQITSLNRFFSQPLDEKSNSQMKRALYKSAQIVTQHFLENEISELHFKSTFLAPEFKDLMNSHNKEKAVKLVQKELKAVAKKESDELTRYLSEQSSEEPLTFWIRRKSAYPTLSGLALRTLCTYPKEAEMAKIFDTICFIVRDPDDDETVESQERRIFGSFMDTKRWKAKL